MTMDRNNCLNLKVLRKTFVGGEDSNQFLLALESPGWNAAAGRFVMVRPVSWGLDPVWGRPFSIAWMDDKELVLFVQVIGRGTDRISKLEAGDEVTVWGPLGNTFAVMPDTPTLLLGGGIGAAPFLGYAKKHAQPENLSFFLGHTQPVENFPLDELPSGLKEIDHFYQKTPEDLPRFIEVLEAKMAAHKDGLILACGPGPFLKTVRRFALEMGAKAQLSLENKMACGVGACLGCVCKDKEGHHVQVCTRGPVFWAEEIEL